MCGVGAGGGGAAVAGEFDHEVAAFAGFEGDFVLFGVAGEADEDGVFCAGGEFHAFWFAEGDVGGVGGAVDGDGGFFKVGDDDEGSGGNGALGGSVLRVRVFFERGVQEKDRGERGESACEEDVFHRFWGRGGS